MFLTSHPELVFLFCFVFVFIDFFFLSPFFFFFHPTEAARLQDLSCSTRDQTHASCMRSSES